MNWIDRLLVVGLVLISVGTIVLRRRSRDLNSTEIDYEGESIWSWWGLRATVLYSVAMIAVHYWRLRSSEPFQPIHWDLPIVIRWVGVATFFVGIALSLLALGRLGANWADTISVRTGGALITVGVFRTVRHPYYAGTILLSLGFVVALGDLWVGIGVVAMCLFLYFRTFREEELLIKSYGEAYRVYQSQTGRLIPKLRK